MNFWNRTFMALCLFLPFVLSRQYQSQPSKATELQLYDCPPSLQLFPKCTCQPLENGFMFHCRGFNWEEMENFLANVSRQDHMQGVYLFLHLQDFVGDAEHLQQPLLDDLSRQLRSLAIINAPGLTQVPNLSWATNLQELSFQGLPVLSNVNFKSEFLPPYLRELLLTSTRITHITYEMLQGMQNLTYLELIGHGNIELVGEPFRDLEGLEELVIVGGLSGFAGNVTLGLENLKLLNLSANDIAHLPRRVLRNMENLEVLDLAYNSLTELPVGFLGNNRKLKKVTLRWNDIAKIPKRLFDSNVQLMDLDLSENYIPDIPAGFFGSHENLVSLNLWDNNIAALHSGGFENLGNLTTLHLGHNLLHRLPAGAFHGLRQLETLHLSQNYLDTIEDGVLVDLPNLRVLDLSRNRLTKIYQSTLHGLNATLKSLNLSGNVIGSVEESALTGIVISELDLSDNSFQCTCENLWLNNYTVFANPHSPAIHCVDTRTYKVFQLSDLDFSSCVPPDTRFLKTSNEGLFFAGTILFLVSVVLAIGIACAVSRRHLSRQSFYPAFEYTTHQYGSDVEVKTISDVVTTTL